MFDYTQLTYSEKINDLLIYHGSQAKLSDYLEISRQSILKWKENDSSIKEENKLKIDVAFCKAFGFKSIDANEVIRVLTQLNKTDFSYFNIKEEDIVHLISKYSSFGSLEIEEADISEKKFDKVISQNNELINDLNKREIFSINNLSSLSNKIIMDTLNNTEDVFPITTEKIRI